MPRMSASTHAIFCLIFLIIVYSMLQKGLRIVARALWRSEALRVVPWLRPCTPTTAQPCVPLISTMHGQPFLIPLIKQRRNNAVVTRHVSKTESVANVGFCDESLATSVSKTWPAQLGHPEIASQHVCLQQEPAWYLQWINLYYRQISHTATDYTVDTRSLSPQIRKICTSALKCATK